MKHFFTFLFIQLFSCKAFAIDKSWTGATSLDWNTASNWSPAGVPGPGDNVTLYNVPNAARILDGVTATVNDFVMQNGSALTVEAGGTLRISRNIANMVSFSALTNATLTNYGTITMDKPQLPSEQRRGGLTMVGNTAIHNHGLMNISVAGDAIVYFMPSSASFTNYGTGNITLKSDKDIQFYDPGQFTNHGLVMATGTGGVSLTSGTITNQGLFFITGGLLSGGNISNLVCGQIVAGSISNELGSFSNMGFVYVLGNLNSRQAGFINNGVLKPGSVTGAFTNNHTAIIDNADPILTFGAAANEIIEGIFLNREGTEPAGVYARATNKFTPNADLPPGPTTLYVKIMPADNDCSFTVPFVHTITIMPVTLVSFSGKKGVDNQVLLKWITSDEQNFDRFEVQRSADARSFETIGTVGSAATGTSLASYEFTDNQSGGARYYRLKMIDTDKTFIYSKIIYTENSSQEGNERPVVGPLYPNPAQEMAQVDLYVLKQGNWTITLIDTTGRTVRSECKMLQKGMNKVAIDHLPPGQHWVRFENGSDSIVRRILVR